MNKIILKGRLTADPELRKTQNDISVCNFTVAVNRRFDREKTDFINCEAWRQTGEFIAKYLGKGKEIALIGELHIDKYDKDGETRYSTRVAVDEVEFCGGRNDGEAKPNNSAPNVEFEECDEDDGDLPF